MLASLALRRAHRLTLQGERESAISLLDEAIEKGTRDPRVGLLRAVLSDCDQFLGTLSDKYPDSQAIGLHFAATLLKKGEIAKAGRIAKKALASNGDNITLQTLLSIIKVKETQVWDHLISQQNDIIMASVKIQAILLVEIEKAIARHDPSDNGAKEQDEGMGGVAGWFFTMLDRLAVSIYCLLRQIINFIRNITNRKRREIQRYQIKGERLEGLGRGEAGAQYRKKVLALEPDNLEALQSLLLYHAEMDDFVNANKYLEELKRVDPDNFGKSSYVKAVEGETFFAQKRFNEAIQKYSGIEDDFPYSHIVRYKKGLSYLRMGEEDKAASGFETALNLPNENLLKERLKKLAGLLDFVN